jgi:hypothetical protein
MMKKKEKKKAELRSQSPSFYRGFKKADSVEGRDNKKKG